VKALAKNVLTQVAVYALAALAYWLSAPSSVSEANPAIAIPIIAAIAGAYSTRQGSKTKQTYQDKEAVFPTEFLPLFFGQYRGPASNDPRLHGTAMGNALYQLLLQAQEGLPASARARGLGSIASGYRGALDQSNRNAALGFGPGALGGADVEASRARAEADFGADFEVKNQQQRMAAFLPLLNFFTQMQGLRFGTPVSTQQSGNALAGGLAGAGAGVSAYNAYKTPASTADPNAMERS